MKRKVNALERVARRTHYILSPANILDLVAMVMAWRGSRKLKSWEGIVQTGTSYFSDIANGILARSTHTESALGEKIDAGGDKIKLAFTIPRVWKKKLAPRSLLAAIVVQNLINSYITAIDQLKNSPKKIHPSTDGKRAMFMQVLSVGMYIVANKVGHNQPRLGKILKTSGGIIGVAGIARGLKASLNYYNKIKK